MDNPILKIMQSGDTASVPADVTKAVNDTGDQSYNGWCQAFVEQVTGVKPQGDSSSAVNAWNSFAKNGQAVPSTQGMKAGDLVYFSPNASNNNDGHVGIYQGNGKFVSATDNGVNVQDMTDWQKKTGQQVLGYIPQNTISDNPILSIMKGGTIQ
jgi:hypothetical protein